MAFVTIPYKSFIGFWHDENNPNDCLRWLRENIGESRQDWIAETTKDEDHAIFWFRRDEDAVAFKLRWI